MIGKTISHYKILEKLGEGGMGIVYKAEDTKLKRAVALKFLPEDLETHEPERARFLQEAQAASALNHPNICTIHDIAEQKGQQFIVMEYIEGRTLRQMIPITKIQDAIGYAVQIGEALEEAHSKGIVHRDIKTDNIMVNTKNQIKVMDFGLAKLRGTLKLTKTSSTVGTLAYMAPEQVQGGEVDERSDIFSFGVVLYEMLSGQLPFRGEHEAAMLYSIVNQEPEPIQKYLPEISSELLHIFNRALEKDPDERYQSAHDMLIDIRRLKKQSTRVVRPAAPALLKGDSGTETPQADPASKPVPNRIFPRPPFIMAGALVLIVILSLLFFRPLFKNGGKALKSHPFQTYKPTLISTNGRPLHAALSPDGKYIVYSVEETGGRSLWMRQTNVTSSIRILPPQDVYYDSFTFSPDGDYVYTVTSGASDRVSALYVVPTLGGSPRKLLEDIRGAVTVSPDGRELAFLRRYSAEGEESLIVCSADGSGQRKLASRKGEDFFIAYGRTSPSWSPDGKVIACPIGSTNPWYMSIMLISVENQSTRLATTFRWNNISRIAWTSEAKGLMVLGMEQIIGGSIQLWYLDISSGRVERVTSDLNDYDSATLSLTSDQTKLLMIQEKVNSSISILPSGDSRRAWRVTSQSAGQDGMYGLDWTPDGRLVFISNAGGNPDIWIMKKDGSERRQLTSTLWGEYYPSVSWDGRMITYQSEKDTTPHIWKMDLDGNNPLRLTSGVFDDYNPVFSPDGNWIYFYSYRDNGRQNLWRVAPNGGEPEKVSDIPASWVSISRDSKRMVTYCYDSMVNRWRPAILSPEPGKPVSFFDLPATAGFIRWMPDGKAVAYIDTRNDVSNIWVLPIAYGKPYPLTHFESEAISDFAWSKDEKDLAVVRGTQTREIVILVDIQ